MRSHFEESNLHLRIDLYQDDSRMKAPRRVPSESLLESSHLERKFNGFLSLASGKHGWRFRKPLGPRNTSCFVGMQSQAHSMRVRTSSVTTFQESYQHYYLYQVCF